MNSAKKPIIQNQQSNRKSKIVIYEDSEDEIRPLEYVHKAHPQPLFREELSFSFWDDESESMQDSTVSAAKVLQQAPLPAFYFARRTKSSNLMRNQKEPIKFMDENEDPFL